MKHCILYKIVSYKNNQHSTIINSQNAEYVSPDKTDIIIITTEDFCSYFQNNNQKAIKSFGNFSKDNSKKKKNGNNNNDGNDEDKAQQSNRQKRLR